MGLLQSFADSRNSLYLTSQTLHGKLGWSFLPISDNCHIFVGLLWLKCEIADKICPSVPRPHFPSWGISSCMTDSWIFSMTHLIPRLTQIPRIDNSPTSMLSQQPPMIVFWGPTAHLGQSVVTRPHPSSLRSAASGQTVLWCSELRCDQHQLLCEYLNMEHQSRQIIM